MAILWILINVLCTVNIRGHEVNFYEARCHEAENEAESRKSEAKAEAEWFGLNIPWNKQTDTTDCSTSPADVVSKINL